MTTAFILTPPTAPAHLHFFKPSHLCSSVSPRILPCPPRRARLTACHTPPTPNDFHPLTPITSSIRHEEATTTPTWSDLSGGSGDNTGGGAGGSGDRPEDSPEGTDDPDLNALLRSRNATLADVPSDILQAYRNNYIPLSSVDNYFHANANFLSRFLMQLGPGLRNRFLADKLFLLKILIEEGIGVFGKLGAELEQRRSKFWQEKEFVLANLITAILADFALVYYPAPSVALERVSSKTGIQAWLANLSTTLPSNIFQTDRPFTLLQRFGGYSLKAGQLFAVGMLCCFAGTIVTNTLVFVREKLDKNYVPKTQKSNPLAVSVLYATFLGFSAGSRYQLINGIENHIFPRIFKNTPKMAEEVTTFFLRYANTFWGSQQWVMFCRFTKVQKNKEE